MVFLRGFSWERFLALIVSLLILWFVLLLLYRIWGIFLGQKDGLWTLFKSSLSLEEQKKRKQRNKRWSNALSQLGEKPVHIIPKRRKKLPNNWVLPYWFVLFGKETPRQKLPRFTYEDEYLHFLDVLLWNKASPLIAHYTKKIGQESVPLVFKRVKSKWGHCKHYGYERYEIMLNRALVFLPEKYLEQVVVHEVAHLQHPHHQKSFRDLVLKLQPENKVLNKDLNKCYGRMVRQSDIFGMRK